MFKQYPEEFQCFCHPQRNNFLVHKKKSLTTDTVKEFVCGSGM